MGHGPGHRSRHESGHGLRHLRHGSGHRSRHESGHGSRHGLGHELRHGS